MHARAPSTAVTGLAHVAIKACDLATTVAFYEQVLGLRRMSRPPFPFPGAWLGVDGQALIHLYGGERAAGAGGDTGSIDHVSFRAHGYVDQRSRLESLGLPFREACPPDTTLAQLFVFDPNGVVLELTYDLRDEPGAKPGRRGAMPRFDPARYEQFATKARR